MSPCGQWWRHHTYNAFKLRVIGPGVQRILDVLVNGPHMCLRAVTVVYQPIDGSAILLDLADFDVSSLSCIFTCDVTPWKVHQEVAFVIDL